MFVVDIGRILLSEVVQQFIFFVYKRFFLNLNIIIVNTVKAHRLLRLLVFILYICYITLYHVHVINTLLLLLLYYFTRVDQISNIILIVSLETCPLMRCYLYTSKLSLLVTNNII